MRRLAPLTAALALMAEPASDSRLANYCAALLNSPMQFAQNVAFGVAANPAMLSMQRLSEWIGSSYQHSAATMTGLSVTHRPFVAVREQPRLDQRCEAER